MKVAEGPEEVTQLALAQGTFLNGNGYEGLTLVQKRVWSGHDLEAWK